MFGILPAWGFFIRHAAGIQMSGVNMKTIRTDGRPAFVLDDVSDSQFGNIEPQINAGVPTFVLMNVRDFVARGNRNLPDTKVENASRKEF